MALRISSVLTGLLALSFSYWVTALGLGELTLHSGLDEPLSAEIEIVNIGNADENQIFVALASQEDFERAGVAWEFHLLDLKFKTDLSDAANPVVKISSHKSIKEPYLDFITQLEWPSGRLLREYTLFLDLPVFDANKSALATENAVSSRIPQESSPRSEQSSSQSASEMNVPAVMVNGASTPYLVKDGDTLWKVAAQTRFESTTIQQQMVAIHAENPSAFVNGNVNLLKKGVALRMPEGDNVKLINAQQAKQLLAEQTRAWNEAQGQSRARELIGNVSATKQQYETPVEGLLRLSTPTETQASRDSQASDHTAGDSTGSTPGVLQKELGVAQEELDRTKRENLELKSKLAGLEAQLSTTTKLFELESDDIKAVQLGVSVQQTGDQVSKIAASESGSGETTAGRVTQDKAALVVNQSAGFDDKGAHKNDTSLLSGPLNGLFTFLKSNWTPLLGLAVVLLGVLLLIVRSKKEDQADQTEVFLSPNIAVIKTKSDESFDVVDGLEEESPLEIEVVSTAAEPESVTAAPFEILEEVDPIGEADIYLSLGNFSNAERVITAAIEAAPNDSKLHLKRLDLFAVQHDAKSFDTYYPALVALNDDDATATADRLRENIQEELFDESDEKALEPTLEERLANELSLEDAALNLSVETQAQDDIQEVVKTERDELVLEADLENSFLGHGESDESADELVLEPDAAETDLNLGELELDLSELELDLNPAQSTPANDSESFDNDLEDSLFGDISLPDELEPPVVASNDVEPSRTNLGHEDDLELNLDSFDFDNDDLDLEIGADESNTQLELAQAYLEMGDESGAKDILVEVLHNGSDEQKQQANELLAKLS